MSTSANPHPHPPTWIIIQLFEVTITVTTQVEFCLTHRRFNTELKGLFTMRYSETLVKTCTARVLDLPTHSRGTRTVGDKEGWRGSQRARKEGKQS